MLNKVHAKSLGIISRQFYHELFVKLNTFLQQKEEKIESSPGACDTSPGNSKNVLFWIFHYGEIYIAKRTALIKIK